MKLFIKIFLVFLLIALILVPVLYIFGTDSAKKMIEQCADTVGAKGLLKKYLVINDGKPSETELITKSESFFIWKDSKGNEYYVSSLKDVPKEFRHTAVKMDSDSIKGGISLMSEKENAEAMKGIEKKPQPEQLKDAAYNILIYSYKGNKELKDATDHIEKFNLPYKFLDVVEKPEYAIELKSKLGLDINKKYSNINFPVIEINGEIIKMKEERDEAGNISVISLDTEKINKKIGIRESYKI